MHSFQITTPQKWSHNVKGSSFVKTEGEKIGDDVIYLKRIKGLRGGSISIISITQQWHDDEDALPAPSVGGVGPGPPPVGVGVAGGDVKLHVINVDRRLLCVDQVSGNGAWISQ